MNEQSKKVTDAFTKAAEKKAAGKTGTHAEPGTRIELKISDIMATDRIRENYGDIEGFAENIKKVGLLQDIAVMAADTPGKYILLNGGRRLAAHKHLGRKTISAIVQKVQDATQAEVATNTHQKGLELFEKFNSAEKLLAPLRKPAGRPKKQDGSESKEETLRGDDLVDWAAKESGLSDRAQYFRVKAILETDTPKLIECFKEGAIPEELCYEIAQLSKPVREAHLRAASKEDGVDKKKLREILNAHREKKRLVRAGIDPEDTDNPPDGFYIPPEDDYNLHFARLGIGTKDKDIATLSKLPIRRYGQQQGIVCIACPNKVLPYAFDLLRKWALFYKGTIALTTGVGTTDLDGLDNASGFIVIGQFTPGNNQVFGASKVPHFVAAGKNPMLEAQGIVANIFGVDAEGQMLDLTSKKGTAMAADWTCYQTKYGI